MRKSVIIETEAERLEIFGVDEKMLQESGAIPNLVLTPEEIFHLQETEKQIEKILLTLPPRDQEVVRRCIDDENLEKICKDFNLPGEQIRQILFKALRKLRQSQNYSEFEKFVN